MNQPVESEPFFSDSNLLKIKICGLTSVRDAQSAIQWGANALGFNLYSLSKRFLTLESARAIASLLPPTAAKVAIVVNPSEAEHHAILHSNIFDAIQFHGDEAPEFCEDSGFKYWIKAIRLREETTAAAQIESFATPYILLDADAGTDYGGSGQQVNLCLAAQLVRRYPQKKFLLAGGLCPKNIAQAVAAVRPFAVDVASGVEEQPGCKSAEKIRAFIEAAHSSHSYL